MYRSPYPDALVPELPLADFVLQAAASRPDKPALIDGGTDRVVTYRQRAYQKLGISRQNELVALVNNMRSGTVPLRGAA